MCIVIWSSPIRTIFPHVVFWLVSLASYSSLAVHQSILFVAHQTCGASFLGEWTRKLSNQFLLIVYRDCILTSTVSCFPVNSFGVGGKQYRPEETRTINGCFFPALIEIHCDKLWESLSGRQPSGIQFLMLARLVKLMLCPSRSQIAHKTEIGVSSSP